MKKFDFTIQILLVVSAVVALVFCGREGIALAAVAQFFMGAWQLLSALITLARTHSKMNEPLKDIYHKYWLLVILYFGVMLIISFVYPYLEFDWLPDSMTTDAIAQMYIFIIPWCIAFFYIYITYKTIQYFESLKNRSFLNIF